MPYRIIAQYMQALLGLLNLAIGSPALATNSAVSAVSASWPLSAMDCTSTVCIIVYGASSGFSTLPPLAVKEQGIYIPNLGLAPK